MVDIESVTLQLGPPIATGATADIHDWRTGQVLKVYHREIPRAVAVREARITRALYAAGVRVPAVGELVEVNGRLALPMEKVSGPPLASRLVDPESGARAGHIAAELHVAMHALSEESLPAMRAQFTRVIEAGPLSNERKERVLRAMETLPDGDRICHGDFHASNILVAETGPVVIDCVVAHRGNPRADAAQTCVAMTEWLYFGRPDGFGQAVARFIESYEHRYFQLCPEGRDELPAWKPIVAAVRLSFPHAATSDEPLLRMVEHGLK
jgi:tRNA A-37 threonylcarbamoyl transferase component Bud32